MDYSGEYLVKIARRAIETFLEENHKLKPPKNVPEDLLDESGVFVTLHHLEHNQELRLRGCIGRIESRGGALVQSTIDSAIDAAFHDSRFNQVQKSEMSNITIEVTILTLPQKIEVEKPQDYFEIIKIGRHGLIAERGPYQRGLLLPQVPVEQKWDIGQYLAFVCQKAGLSPNAWMDLKTTILSFEGIIYSEVSPNGQIVNRTIH
ncbi:MAG: TIGR00296 family protein [Candidatus Hodarchaeales archaeon]